MRLAILGTIVCVALAGDVCRADWPPKPIRNTPFDPGTWVPRLPAPDDSYITDPQYPSGVTGRWDYNGGTFVDRGNGRWVEVYDDGNPPNHFRELGRNGQNVELWDNNRKMAVLLTPTQGLFRRAKNEPWQLWRAADGRGSTGGFR